jgi:hypothetical protein
MKQICKVEGCGRFLREGEYCSKHYQQIYKYGHILKRTRFDPNEIIPDYINNCAYIILYNRKGQERARAIIDLEDIDKVKSYKWSLTTHRYIYNSNNNLFLHNLIMGIKGIDHINGNSLDNKKCNLRMATKSQNAMNSKIPNNNTSGCKGVFWNNIYNKYQANICINYNTIHLGYFKKIEDAIKARKEAEIKYHGKYRRGE